MSVQHVLHNGLKAQECLRGGLKEELQKAFCVEEEELCLEGSCLNKEHIMNSKYI